MFRVTEQSITRLTEQEGIPFTLFRDRFILGQGDIQQDHASASAAGQYVLLASSVSTEGSSPEFH